jgi:hypothetical protein
MLSFLYYVQKILHFSLDSRGMRNLLMCTYTSMTEEEKGNTHMLALQYRITFFPFSFW